MYSNQYACGICTLEIHLLHLNIFPCPHTVGDPVFWRFEVLRVMSLGIQVLCDVTLWQCVTGSWHEGIFCLDLQGSSSPRRLANTGEGVVINWHDSTTLWIVRVASRQVRGGVGGGRLSFDVLETHHRGHCVTFWKTWNLDTVWVITLACRYRPSFCNYHVVS